jgi:addiction module HigA family antidote
MNTSQKARSTMTHDTLPMITPGEVLAEEFLKPLGITRYRLSQATGIRQDALGAIVRGKRAITAEVALRLSKALGTTPEFWMNLQSLHDLEVVNANKETREKLEGVEKLVA